MIRRHIKPAPKRKYTPPKPHLSSTAKYKARLRTMTLEEIQALARQQNVRAQQELYRRTGISTVVTKADRENAHKRDLAAKIAARQGQ